MAAAGDEVKVLGNWSSPFVMRVRIALKLKEVRYKFVELLWNKSELLLNSNPIYNKIPVLIHAGRPICESTVIVQYIDDVWASSGPSSILPSDPYDRAIARFWAIYIDDKLFHSIGAILQAKSEEAVAEAAEQVLAALQLLEEDFRKCSKGKGFFNGDTLGYLDIALGSHLGWLKVIEKMTGIKFLDEAKLPLLVGWAERFCSENVVNELMPDTDKLVEFAKMLQSWWGVAPTK